MSPSKLMDNHWVQIRAGRSNTKMVGMARANFPQVPEFPASGAVQDLRAVAQEHGVEDDLRHLERGEPLHTQRRAAGAEGRVDGHGRHRRPPPRPHRKARRDPRRHLRREEDPGPAQGAQRALFAARLHRGRTPRVRRRRAGSLLPCGGPRPHQPQAHRPVPQLRGRPAARQQQVRHRPQRRPHELHPAQ